jgi:hypothetical protein
MPKLIVFNQVTLDGYFAGENGDLSWAHTSDRQDAEWRTFVEENAKGGGVLIRSFRNGRVLLRYPPEA